MDDESSRLPVQQRSPTLPQSDLSPDDVKWLSGRIKVLLHHFFSPGDTSLETAVLEDFLGVLSRAPNPRVWVQAACISYLTDPPRTASGAPRRPAPGDILRLAQRLEFEANKAQRIRAVDAEPVRERCSPEALIKILEENGFITASEAARRRAALARPADEREPAAAVLPMPQPKRIPKSEE